jgi:hypothetical protein
MSPLDDAEVNHAAAVIVAAFLNPRKLNYYYIGVGNDFGYFAF